MSAATAKKKKSGLVTRWKKVRTVLPKGTTVAADFCKVRSFPSPSATVTVTSASVLRLLYSQPDDAFRSQWEVYDELNRNVLKWCLHVVVYERFIPPSSHLSFYLSICICSITNHTTQQFSLVLCVPSVLWHCWLGHLTRKPVPDMTYNVFGGTLSLTQSINQSISNGHKTVKQDEQS